MRKILVEFQIDWENYDDVNDELIVEDIYESCVFKKGVAYKIIHDNIDKQEQMLKEIMSGLKTIDNLPELMAVKWMKRLMNKYLIINKFE